MVNKLEEKLQQLGRISFKEFMRIALYDEKYGYYTQNIRSVGRGGDFSTLATINDTLARSLCSWIRDRWKEDKNLNHNIIEVGAGDGSLTEKLLKDFSLWSRLGLKYHIVETSPKLSLIQRETLRDRKCIIWHERMEDALSECSGNTLIISNELVDAFPVELIQWSKDENKWHKLMVQLQNESWTITRGHEYKIKLNSSISDFKNFNDGQIIERHDEFISWFNSWSNLWKLGHMLTIDYGELFPFLYYRRSKGTLRSYFFQQRHENIGEILSKPGLQDITSDVDFTDIRARIKTDTIEEIKYVNQSAFINEHITQLPPWDPSISEDGAGSAFKILWHKKNRNQ